MTTTLETTEAHTIEWDDELGLPIFIWNEHVTGERFRESARAWEAVIDERGADKYLVNTEQITAHGDAESRWLAETWIPDLIDKGVRRGAGVYKDSALASMDMEAIEESLSAIDPSYEFRVFASDAEAREWLADQ